MKKLLTILCLVALYTPVYGQVNAIPVPKPTIATEAVLDALAELRTAVQPQVSGFLACGKPRAAEMRGGLQEAIQLLGLMLFKLGWEVLVDGQLEKSYGAVVDPDPQTNQLVLLGIMPSEGRTVWFIARCRVLPVQGGEA
jgi:hypothetical protein